MISEHTEPQEGMIYVNDFHPVALINQIEGRTAYVSFFDEDMENEITDHIPVSDFNEFTPFGMLNLTHTLKDGKLTKIERDEIAVGDVFKTKSGDECVVINIEDDIVESLIFDDIYKKTRTWDIHINCFKESMDKRIGIANLNIKYIRTDT